MESGEKKIEECYFLLFGKGKIMVEEKWVPGVYLFGPKNLSLFKLEKKYGKKT